MEIEKFGHFRDVRDRHIPLEADKMILVDFDAIAGIARNIDDSRIVLVIDVGESRIGVQMTPADTSSIAYALGHAAARAILDKP